MQIRFRSALLGAAFSLAACSGGASGTAPLIASAPTSHTLNRATNTVDPQVQALRQHIKHFVIIYQENWGFDALYGNFPGANGYANALGLQQVDANGNPITTLPQPTRGGVPDPAFNSLYANGAQPKAAPFDLSTYYPTNAFTADPNHNFYLHQMEIDGGRMDKYLAFPGSAPGDGVSGLTLGYYDATNLPEGKLAQQYVLADNFFQSSFGGSFINNQWMICACTPTFPNAPSNLVEDYLNGMPVEYGTNEHKVTGDGYAVNTMFSSIYPQISKNSPLAIVPPQTAPTIGDALTNAGVTWNWYAGGWNNAVAGQPDGAPLNFQAHHQPFTFYSKYAPGTPGATHLKDESDFFNDLANNNLPDVSWLKPIGEDNEHPGYANLIAGQTYVANVINQIQQSKAWPQTMIVVVYDEAGGHFDHVSPPQIDRWGPGTRVPALIISPFAKHGVVDHTQYETVSIMKTLEVRYEIAPIATRDAAAQPLLNVFDFTQPVPQAYARRPLGILPGSSAPKTRSAPGRPVTELDD